MSEYSVLLFFCTCQTCHVTNKTKNQMYLNHVNFYLLLIVTLTLTKGFIFVQLNLLYVHAAALEHITPLFY